MSINTHDLLFTLGIGSSLLGLVAAWFLSLLGLPGNWLMVGIAAVHAWLAPDDSRWDISWTVVVVLVVLAAIGELVELGLSAAGVSRLGGSRRGMLLALLCSFVGAMLGGSAGSFLIPVVGTLVGIILGASLGALVGTAWGELWKGRTFDKSLEIGHAAFWGRLLGSMAKLIIGSAMLAMAMAAVVLA